MFMNFYHDGIKNNGATFNNCIINLDQVVYAEPLGNETIIFFVNDFWIRLRVPFDAFKEEIKTTQ